MAESETTKKTSTSSIMPDWSLLPEELLHNIIDITTTPVNYLVPSGNDDLFLVEVVFPTVGELTCRVSRLDEETGQWVEVSDLGDRVLFVGGHLGNISCSAQELPHGLSGNSILFTNGSGKVTFPYKYGVHTGNAEDDLDCWRSSMEDRVVILNKSFPVLAFKCSVKVKIPGTEPTLINMLDCQILFLGHQCKMIGRNFRRVAILPLDKEGKRGEFVVLLNNYNSLLVLESAKMRWRQLTNIPDSLCQDLVTFRGRFYATFFHSSKIVVIDPYSLEVTLLFPSPQEPTVHCLVPSGSDELFLVEVTVPTVGLLDISRSKCKVSRLDEADTWVEVSDLGDRILFIGQLGNVSCSAKELPHGCGLSGNSILFTNQPGNESFAYK